MDDLCKWLQVSPQTVYKWRSLGSGPPAMRLGKHLRWRRRDVEQWLTSRHDDVLEA
jgi:excisionase family DNA binding protein